MRNHTWLILLIVSLHICSCKSQYISWQYDKVMNGVEFKKLRYLVKNGDTTAIIGYLRNNTTIQGYPCSAGWVHFSKDGKLKLLQLVDATTIHNFKYPKNSWIRLGGEYLVCAFPHDTVIQGYLCKGSGGVKGIQTSFYKSGRLRSFYTNKSLLVNEIVCYSGCFNIIILNEDGTLKSCKH
jgi:hypothetical protein